MIPSFTLPTCLSQDRAAREQIQARQCKDAFKYTRVKSILKYGIGCYRKSCQVALGR